MPKRKEVERWFADYDNPMKEVVRAMRDIVLAVDPRVDECIKWQAPTFTFQGNIASFFPRSKKHASLMFHQGAKIPGSHPRLEGTGDTSRVLKVASLGELRKARRDLEAVVRAWIQWKDGGPAGAKKSSVRKKAVTQTTSKKKETKKKETKKKGDEEESDHEEEDHEEKDRCEDYCRGQKTLVRSHESGGTIVTSRGRRNGGVQERFRAMLSTYR